MSIETSFPLEPPPEYPAPYYARYEASAEILEVGTPLQDDPEDIPFEVKGFFGEPDSHVRLRDEHGYLWTVGWETPGMDSTAALIPGSEVHFLYVVEVDGPRQAGGVFLSDERGPLLLIEKSERDPFQQELLVTESERGLSVEIDTENVYADGYDQHDLVTFSSECGSASLRTGEVATFPVCPGPREMELVLSSARRNVYGDCFIGCELYSWTAWALSEIP